MKNNWVWALVQLSEVMFQINFRFLNSALIKKMFKGQKTFAIRNDSLKRFDVHSKNKYVLTKEI